MSGYSNIAISARGQAGSDLWIELTQTTLDTEPRVLVESVVDFIVNGQMDFGDLADYISYNNIEFHTLNEIDSQLGQNAPVYLETPTSFLRRIVRADLTDYVMAYTLPRLLEHRTKGFVWNEETRYWNTKEYAEAQG